MRDKNNSIGLLMGTFSGYFFLHPAVMALSFLMSDNLKSAHNSLTTGLVVEVLRAFSFSMLPWSLAFAVLGGLIGFYLDKLKRAGDEKSKLIEQLQASLSEVDKLNDLLPICATCKKIRDDNGYWNQLEIYLKERTGTEFSHGICPECAEELYPGFKEKRARKNLKNGPV